MVTADNRPANGADDHTTDLAVGPTTESTAQLAAVRSRRPGAARTGLRVLQGLLVIAYLYSAWTKLSADPQAVDSLAQIGVAGTGPS